MIGNYASKVNFNYDGLRTKFGSRDLFEEWEENMKGAISGDVIAEDIQKDKRRLEEAHRYALACEEVIINLVFWCKWHCLPHNSLSDESKG